MTVTARDVLETAKCLAEMESEAAWRSASSRAYYAAFHSLIPLCQALPASNDEARVAAWVSHGELVRRIEQWLPTGEYVGLQALKVSAGAAVRQLRMAREQRVIADYDLGAVVTAQDAKSQIGRARNLLKFVVQVENEMSRRSA